MRKFNPDRELKKIQHGSRNKIIIGVIALLIILGISSSYALYQVRYSKRIIYTKVAPFSNHDIDLAVLVDGKIEDDFPEKDAGKIYDKIDCGKTSVKAYWDYDKWALVVETSKKAKCTVYFKTGTDSEGNKLDTSGANPPELYQGLIPIKYDEDGTIRVADPNSTDWYNYDEKKWANAVLIDNKGFAADLSGNGNHGELVGGAQITNEGLQLDGNDDGVYLGDMLKDLFKHSNTIQVKFKRTEVNNRSTLLGNYPSSNFVQYEVWSDNLHRCTFNADKIVYREGLFESKDFVTLTYVFDRENGKLTIYQDEIPVVTWNDAGFKNYSYDYSSSYIGRDNSQIGANSVSFQGTIEKFLVYYDILNEDEIRHNLNAESGKVEGDGVIKDNLRLYYDFKVKQKIDTTPGTILSMTAISQMYVWIPRYKYQLFNAINGNVSNERMINVLFESGTESTGDVTCEVDELGKETCENAINGNWYTHPAFKFGDTDLTGIWVGKFETGGDTTNLLVKPSITSLRSKMIGEMFNAIRNMELTQFNQYGIRKDEVDIHMMKNIDWGAATYLSNSIYGRYVDGSHCVDGGCVIWLNNVSSYITGCSSTPSSGGGLLFNTASVDSCSAATYWNGEYGRHASTTDNIYGLYDMAGGAWEYVASNMVDNKGVFSSLNFNIDEPSKKYYDVYQNSSSGTSFERGHLGDATRETLQLVGSTQSGWNNVHATLHSNGNPWIDRGGQGFDGNKAGIFAFYGRTGEPYSRTSVRIVITAQDGNDPDN